MPLSPSTTAELQAELREIEREISTLEDRAFAIQKVLGVAPRTVLRPPNLPLMPPPREAQNIPPQYQGMTMRQVVAKHLHAHPGWKAADVTQALRKEGYARGGATRFSHRIYNEIWRMEKDRLVMRNDDGGFVLTSKGAEIAEGK
jgi:hypothetical protein